jgi:UPF0716 protein FxsA
MRILLLLFVILPLAELWLLIWVGSIIGALPTLALVVLTAVAGVWLLRRQGLDTLLRGRQRLEMGEVPAEEMIEGMVLAMSGVLLLLPGFATDTLGLLGLVAPLRRWLVARIVPRVAAGRWPFPPGSGEGPRTLEGEYWRKDDDGD